MKHCPECHKPMPPILDIWMSIADMKADKGFIVHLLPWQGCSECDSEGFMQYVRARIDKSGEPFTDTAITKEGLHLSEWLSPDKEPFMMIIPGKP